MKVAPIWVNPGLLSADTRDAIRVMACPCDGQRCLNTIIVREFAKLQGREVRRVTTLDGWCNFSEKIDGVWHMFRMELKLWYAKLIDLYDKTGKQFLWPKTAPFKSVEWKGPCKERADTVEIRVERNLRYRAMVKSGEWVKREKKPRNLQAPKVEKRGEMERGLAKEKVQEQAAA
jgi:hypothetical protein